LFGKGREEFWEENGGYSTDGTPITAPESFKKLCLYIYISPGMKTHQNGSKCVWTASVVLGMSIGKKSTLPALFFCYHKYQLKLQIGVDKSPEVNYTRTNRKIFLPKGGDKA